MGEESTAGPGKKEAVGGKLREGTRLQKQAKAGG